MSDLQKQEEIKDIKPNECIRRIQSKFQLNGEEIKKIYELEPYIIKKILLTEEGSFYPVSGKFTVENLEGNGKVCIQYSDNHTIPHYLILRKIKAEETNSISVDDTLYQLLEKNITFLEKAHRASDQIFFKQLLKNKKNYV